MRDLPKHLNTKFDYYYIKDCGLFSREQWAPAWEALLKNRQTWQDLGALADGDEGTTDDTHRVESFTERDNETDEEKTVLHQFELRDNPAHPFFRLGFTEDEVLEALTV